MPAYPGSNSRFFLVVMLSLILLMGGCARKEIKLEYNLPKGDVSKYKMEVNVTVSAEPKKGEKEQVKSRMEMALNQKVEDVDVSGNMDLVMTYDSISIETDGRKQEPPPQFGEGKAIKIRMSKRGQILDIGGFEGIPGLSGRLKEVMEGIQAVLPEKPVMVGESWNTSSEKVVPFPVPGGTLNMKLRLDTKNMLEGLERIKNMKCARIKIDTELKQELKGGGQAAAPVKIDTRGTGKATGTMYLALGNGKIVRLDQDTEMENKITIDVRGRKQETVNLWKSHLFMELQ